MSNRKYVALVALVVVVGAALLAVQAGKAGNSGTATFTVAVVPGQLTAGNQGLVIAKFSAASGPQTGSATGTVITITFPDGTTAIAGSGCTVTNTTATCQIGTVHAGQTARAFLTFTTPSATTGLYKVTGTATYDGGTTLNNGGNNSIPASATATLVAATGATQGKCGSSSDQTGNSASSTQLKGTLAAWQTGATGLPCTPVDGGVADGIAHLPTGDSTTGIWFVSVPLLGSTGSDQAQVALTFYNLPSGTTWKKFQIYELPNYPDLTPLSVPVPPCTAVPGNYAGASCIASRSNFGSGGVQLNLLVKGSTVDPGYAG